MAGTHIVRTISGSVWGQPAVLQEDLAIGALEGREELMFGQIQAMAADSRGGVYVFDSQVPALRYFDSLGNYVRTLGRAGSGPGEYRDIALGLAVRRDGQLLMRDPRNARLNLYGVDGSPSGQWPVASGLYVDRAMTLDTADQVYLKILTSPPEPNKPWKIGLLHLDATGRVIDTIPDPQISGAPQSADGVFFPTKVWAWSPLGYMVVGVNRDYGFELRKPGEPILRIERLVDRVPVLPEERAAYEAFNHWTRQHQGQFLTSEIPPVPDAKPAYRDLYVGEAGWIWVHRHMRAERLAEPGESSPDRPPPLGWREPTVFDVFEPDGTYLGEVPVPPRTSLYLFGTSVLWGVRLGTLDQQYVVRLRLRSNRTR